MAKEFNKYKLPKNWVWVELGDILETTSGGTPSRGRPDYYNGTIPWVKSGELNYNIITKTEEQITDAALQGSSAKLFPKGTLLIALYGATVGRLAFLGIDASTNQAVCGIFQNSNIDVKYIYYCFMNQYSYLISLSAGGAQPNISQTIIKKVNVPLPPLNEQNRIVDKLDELLSELEKGKEQLQTSLEQLKVYRQSILKHAFEGKLTNENVKEGKLPNGWHIERFDNLTTNYDGKRIPLSRAEREKRLGKYRYYGATGVIDHIDDFIFDGRYLLIGEDGANLVTKSRELAFIAEGKFWVNNHAHIVQTKEGYHLDYIYHYFNSLNLSEYVTGSAQPKLSQSNLNKIPIPVPPTIGEQEKISLELDKQFSIINETEKSIVQNLNQTDTFRQSLLQKAFEGKLVEQDPTDEPAEKLLERIRALRQTQGKQGKAKPEKKGKVIKSKNRAFVNG